MDAAIERARSAHNSRMEQAYMTGLFVRSEKAVNLNDYLVNLKTGELLAKEKLTAKQVPAQQALSEWFTVLKSMES